MRVLATAMALVAGMSVLGCSRADLPVQRYSIAKNPAEFSTCVFRDAQRGTRVSEPVTRTRVDDPMEYQVAKTYHGTLVWELDVSAAVDGGSSLLMRHHPGLLNWDGDLMKSVNACADGGLLRRL